MHIVRLRVKLGGKPPADPAELRRTYNQRDYPVAAPPTRGIRRQCHVEEGRTGGRVVYTLRPRLAPSGWHVIYTHGGGFVNALIKPHWDIIQSLVAATGATVTVPLYPLAPEHEHREAFVFLEQVYRNVLEQVHPANLILCGDSAGGNLALAQTLHFRDSDLPLPAHIIMFSPLADASASNPDMVALEHADVMLRLSAVQQWGRWWAGSADLKSPLLSPLYGDLRRLPPIQIYIGSDDILLPDARLLRDRVLSAGGRVSYRETPGGIHVFMGATFTPEARNVFRHIRESLGPAGDEPEHGKPAAIQ
jgi:epsilon-lactone hydrolase